MGVCVPVCVHLSLPLAITSTALFAAVDGASLDAAARNSMMRRLNPAVDLAAAAEDRLTADGYGLAHNAARSEAVSCPTGWLCVLPVCVSSAVVCSLRAAGLQCLSTCTCATHSLLRLCAVCMC